jgi:hypothetical protein
MVAFGMWIPSRGHPQKYKSTSTDLMPSLPMCPHQYKITYILYNGEIYAFCAVILVDEDVMAN